MGAAESSPSATATTTTTTTTGAAPSSISFSSSSASPSLQTARPLYRLQNLTSPPPTDPESHFFTALFHDISQLPASVSRSSLITDLVSEAVHNPTTSPHASALSSTLRAAVHHLRLPPSPPQLGALQLAHAAIDLLHRIASSHTAASLPLAAGPAETTLPPPDRVDLANSLRAHLLLAALDLLAFAHPSPFSSKLAAASIMLIYSLIQPRSHHNDHQQQQQHNKTENATTMNSSSTNKSSISSRNNLLASLTSYAHASSVLTNLLQRVQKAAPHANTEHLLLLSAPPTSHPKPPDKAVESAPWDAFDLFSMSSSSIALRTGFSDVVSALSSATSKFSIRRTPSALGHQSDGSDTFTTEQSRSPRTTASATSNANEAFSGANNSSSSFPTRHSDPSTVTASPGASSIQSAPSTPKTISAPLQPTDIFDTGEYALCILAQLCTQPGSTFQLCLRDLRDGEHCSFAHLHDALARWLAHPLGALLGHLLLVGNRNFRTFALARTDPETLLLPLLAGLRRRCAPGGVSADAYIPATTLLALTSDRGFCEAIDAVPVPEHWLHLVEDRARLGTNTLVVSGAVLLVCARAVHQSLVMRRRRPDDYLSRVCLAVMGNIAGDATNVHPLVAERLVSLVEFLGRRRKRAIAIVEKSGKDVENQKISNVEVTNEAEQGEEEKQANIFPQNVVTGEVNDIVVQKLSQFVAMGLEIIVGVLRARSTVAVNRHLVYTLMHREGVLESKHVGGSSAKAEALVHMLRRVLHFFSGFVEEVEVRVGNGIAGSIRSIHHAPGISVERVFEVIEENARMLHGDVFEGIPPMNFAFKEVESSEKFLCRYAVSLAKRKMRVSEMRPAAEKLMDLPAGFGVYQLSR